MKNMSWLNREVQGKYMELRGTPRILGKSYGEQVAKGIRNNRHYLLNAKGWGCNVLSLMVDPRFIKWVGRREALIGDNWPWLLEEIRGVAEGSGVAYKEVLMLNLRAWWYNDEELVRRWGYAKDKENTAGDTQCTGLAVRLADGTVACAGGLDDGAFVYNGAVMYRPKDGYSYLSFPITGTIWGSMGMNSAGLCVRAASGSFVRKAIATMEHDACEYDELNQDIVFGVILRTCATATEAKTVCEKFPFNGNALFVDAGGNVVSLQNTPAGPVCLPFDNHQVITNHLVDDEDYYKLYGSMGVLECAPGPNTDSRLRRGYVSKFLRETRGALTEAELVRFIGTRIDRISTVNNRYTLAVGYSLPQVHRNTMWCLIPQDEQYCDQFVRYDI
jgi:hypothetical protein